MLKIFIYTLDDTIKNKFIKSGRNGKEELRIQNNLSKLEEWPETRKSAKCFTQG